MLALGAVLVLGSIAVVRQMRDPTPANLELAALVRRVDSATTPAQLLQMAGGYALLRARHESSVSKQSVAVYTPNRPFADNWVACFQFGADGRLVRMYTGIVDYAPVNPKPSGFPPDHCFGSAVECRLP